MDNFNDSINKVVGRLESSTFLQTYPHSSALVHNLSSKNSNNPTKTNIEQYSALFRKFPYEVTYPLPFASLNDVDRQVINGLDPALSVVNKKKFWEKHKTRLVKFCGKKQAESLEESLAEPGRKYSVPRNMILLADHMSKDPDEYFNANYNSYFTGGNLTSFQIDSKKFLVAPKLDSSGEAIALESLSKLNQLNFESEDDSSFVVPVNGKSPIFQLESANGLILSRQKKKVCLFSMQEKNDKHLLKRQFFVEKEIPLFSISLLDKHFCVISADRKLEIFDVGQQKSILNGVLDCEEGIHMSDKWCSTHFVDNNVLCFIDRSSVGFIDLRVRQSVLDKWYIGQVAEYCEEVFCGAPGSGVLQYIVSNHQLLCLDPRAGFSKRWTHGIMHSPAYISVHSSNMSDKIFIGSQRSDCVVFVENNISQSDSIGTYQPYALPSLSETLHTARLNGCCLGNVVPSRFAMCLTGLCCVENDDGFTLFQSTSTDDIFYQNLTLSDSEKNIVQLDNKAIEKLEKWEKYCETLSVSDNNCIVSQILEDDHIKNYITNYEEFTEPSEAVDVSKDPWKISKKELLSYCDYLAPKLLHEWGIEDIEEWTECGAGDEMKNESSDEEDFTEKVTKWINTINDMEKDSELTLAKETESEIYDDNSIIDDRKQLLSSTLIETSKFNVTYKKKKFVSGF